MVHDKHFQLLSLILLPLLLTCFCWRRWCCWQRCGFGSFVTAGFHLIQS